MSTRLFLTGFGTALVIGLAAVAVKRSGGTLRGTDDDDDEALFEPETSDKWKAMIAKQKARKNERKRAVKDALAVSPALIIDNGHRKMLLLVTGEMQDREYGALRVTTFADDGPMGHATRKDMDEITDEIIDSGWKTLRPATDSEVDAWTSSDKFVIGSKKVAAVQALNTLHYRAKDKDAARAVEDRANKLAAEGKWDDAVLVLQQGVKDLGRLRLLGAPNERDRTIAWVVEESARRAKTWRKGKVFIADAYEQLKRDGRDDGMSLDEFKHELVRLHREGALVLARADLVAAMPPESVRASEARSGPAEFHFIRLGGF